MTTFIVAAIAISPVWTLPQLATYRPWIPGSPFPVVRALTPGGQSQLREDDRDGLVTEQAESEASTHPIDEASAAAGQADAGLGELLAASGETAPASATAAPSTPAQLGVPALRTDAPVTPASASATATAPAPVALSLGSNTAASALPSRAPGIATPLIDPDFRGMDSFYRGLAQNDGLVRAAHFGDSTIAADGITSTIRRRLQARFGNGGPGYINAGTDPRWSSRPELATKRSGDWSTKSILLGGASGKYGYGGIVSTASDGAYLVVHAPKAKDGTQVPMAHLELWHQTWEGAGGWWLSADGADLAASTANAPASDIVEAHDVDGGYTKVAFGASGAPVSFYGLVMETAGPGVVWDALGVIGVGTKSFNFQNPAHLERMVAQRKPDLIVMMLGGNELGYPIISKGDGSEYGAMYRKTLKLVRAGAPRASCLVLTPLDQGTRDDGEPRSKPALPKMVRAQARVAIEEGCAFWNSWAAMGGDGSIIRWAARKNPLAWTDLLHLSGAGLDIIGQLLSDAIEADFEQWQAAGGTARSVPAGASP